MKPSVSTIEGSVVSRSLVKAIAHDRERFKTDFIAVVVKGVETDSNGVVGSTAHHELRFGVNQVADFGYETILFVGNQISVSVEKCIANVTEYVDPNGEIQLHEYDHLKPTRAFEVPIMELAMKGVPAFACEMLDKARSKRAEEITIAEKFYGAKAVPTDVPSAIARLKAQAENATGIIRKGIESRIAELESQLEPVTEASAPEKPAKK